jgi:RarD protein
VSQSPTPNQQPKNTRKGLLFAFGAYAIWGSFPLIIHSLDFASPYEVVGWRIIFGMVLAAAMLTAMKAWGPLWQVVRNRRLLSLLVLSSALIYVNWLVYVLGVSSGHILESSLGYFINPLVTVVLAVFFQREKLTRIQWVAVILGAVAVTVLTLDYGHLPLIALSLALSFGFYGLVKARTGGQITPLIGYSVETAMCEIWHRWLLQLVWPGAVWILDGHSADPVWLRRKAFAVSLGGFHAVPHPQHSVCFGPDRVPRTNASRALAWVWHCLAGACGFDVTDVASAQKVGKTSDSSLPNEDC